MSANKIIDDLEEFPSTLAKLYEHYETTREDNRREHLGASGIGHKCDRKIWFDFRWVGHGITEGRILRLLERGKREESWVVDDLRAIGITVWDTDPDTGEQIHVKWGHFGGSSDGVVLGLVEKPEEPCNFECKTINLKGHKRLQELGMKRAKPEHYAQCQVYMHGLELAFTFYVSVCKDNDEIYIEFVKYHAKDAQKFIDKGVKLSLTDEAPPVMPESFPPCMLTSKEGVKYPCDYFDVCHRNGKPRVSCRTCMYVTPHEDGTWTCDLDDKAQELSGDDQRKACSKHLFNPTMINADPTVTDDDRLDFTFSDGEKWTP